MSRLISALVFACLLGVQTCASAENQTVSYNRAWWNSLSNDQQISVIQGIENGYQFGYMDGWDEAGGNILKMNWKKTRFPREFGYYQSAITDIYDRHPESTDFSPASIMQCLSEVPYSSTCKKMIN